jgi:hypothetical protein
MLKFQMNRRLTQVALDVLFVAWVLHVLVTGHVIPERLADLFSDQPPAVARTDQEVPAEVPLDRQNQTPAGGDTSLPTT